MMETTKLIPTMNEEMMVVMMVMMLIMMVMKMDMIMIETMEEQRWIFS